MAAAAENEEKRRTRRRKGRQESEHRSWRLDNLSKGSFSQDIETEINKTQLNKISDRKSRRSSKKTKPKTSQIPHLYACACGLQKFKTEWKLPIFYQPIHYYEHKRCSIDSQNHIKKLSTSHLLHTHIAHCNGAGWRKAATKHTAHMVNIGQIFKTTNEFAAIVLFVQLKIHAHWNEWHKYELTHTQARHSVEAKWPYGYMGVLSLFCFCVLWIEIQRRTHVYSRIHTHTTQRCSQNNLICACVLVSVEQFQYWAHTCTLTHTRKQCEWAWIHLRQFDTFTHQSIHRETELFNTHTYAPHFQPSTKP